MTGCRKIIRPKHPNMTIKARWNMESDCGMWHAEWTRVCLKAVGRFVWLRKMRFVKGSVPKRTHRRRSKKIVTVCGMPVLSPWTSDSSSLDIFIFSRNKNVASHQAAFRCKKGVSALRNLLIQPLLIQHIGPEGSVYKAAAQANWVSTVN